MSFLVSSLRFVLLSLVLAVPGIVLSAGLSDFEGQYAGSADFVFNNETKHRDLRTTIDVTRKGFTLTWTSVSYNSDGRTKEKTYTIDFVPSTRDNIYKSAMKENVFGKLTPLDPLQGEPYVWARLDDDTLSVFSLFINEVGGYEIQEFHRTLVDEGLRLRFLRVHQGIPEKEIVTTLKRLD